MMPSLRTTLFLAVIFISFFMFAATARTSDSFNNVNSSDGSNSISTNPDIRLRVPEGTASERNFDLLFEFDFFSKYISKGLPSSNGPVWQPSITAEYYNIGLSIWSNFVLNDEPNQGEFNEVDILPYYNLKIGNFSFIPSVNFMIGLNSDPASLNYMSHNVIRPQFRIAYTIGHFTPYLDAFFYVYPTNRFGIYSDFGVNFNYVFTEWFQIDTAVQFAVGGKRWNSPRIADAGTRLNNFEYVLSLNFLATKQLSFAPVIHVVITIPEALRKSLDEPDYFWGGLQVKYNL